MEIDTITRYASKDYLKGKIIDIEKASVQRSGKSDQLFQNKDVHDGPVKRGHPNRLAGDIDFK